MAKERGVSKKLYALAVKMETDGMKFYRDLADKVGAPLAKEMFKSFVKDEERHLQVVKAIFSGIPLVEVSRRFQPGTPAQRLQTAFSKAKGKGSRRVPAGLDEVRALELAMEMEKASYRIYHLEAEKVSSPSEKRILERLAREEGGHFEILNNSHAYLTDNGGWFIWQDHAIIDGG